MKLVPQLRAIQMIWRTIVLLFVLAIAFSSQAQSTNIEFPTSVVTNEVSGMIEARDIGDSRLTRHFYLLTGTPGDLIVAVESNNLNGDVDLFTAGSLRPLTKLSIFAGLSTTSTSKSVFLRQRESVILRIEARSSNDEPGTYRVRFSGGFEPMAEATTENPEPTVSTSRNKGRNVRRVNSAGARVNEPLPDIATTTEPENSVVPGSVELEKTEPKPPTVAVTEPAKPKPTKPVRVAKTKPPVRAKRKRATTTAKKKEGPAPVPETTASSAPETLPQPAPVEPALNPRLIIETRDGVRVERYMSEVRRVSVERGQLIVVTNTGKIERRPMTSVLRVAIEP